MRKWQYFILIILIGFLCALWSPWNYWDFNPSVIFGVVPPEEKAGLRLTSLAGELTAFIDGEERGTTDPETGTLTIPDLQPGEREVRLVRSSSLGGAYVELNRVLNFAPKVDLVISYELGPTLEFSEGQIIYAQQNTTRESGARVYFQTNGIKADVSLNGVSLGQAPIEDLELALNQQHRIVVSKDGYETQEFLLLPNTQTERDKFNGYDIFVEVNLFLQPLEVND